VPQQVLRSLRAAVAESGVADGLKLGFRVVDQHAVPKSHGFDKRGVGSSDFIRKDKLIGMLLQLLVCFTVDAPGEDDPRVACGFQGTDIAFPPGIISYNH
jgi:hypothetical protein